LWLRADGLSKTARTQISSNQAVAAISSRLATAVAMKQRSTMLMECPLHAHARGCA